MFICLILVPVALLTYRSVQSLQDERDSVLEEQQLLASLLQDSLERVLNHITEDLMYVDAQQLDLRMYDSFAEVEQPFMTDAEGNLLYPLSLPLQLGERGSAFGAQLHRGECWSSTMRITLPLSKFTGRRGKTPGPRWRVRRFSTLSPDALSRPAIWIWPGTLIASSRSMA
jgi:hypothetical protein